MDKNKKKKKKPSAPGTRTPPQSAYKIREAEGKASQADSKFQKEFGKAKDALRKG